jgi:Family of unknown function (DUF6152)
MMRRLLLGVFAGAMLSSGAAYAHHSFQATYDTEKTVTIKGTLVSFDFRNPHSFVHVMAPDSDGQMQRWGIEWSTASVLSRQGVTRTTFKPGDVVIITGSPGRDPGDHRIRMQAIHRPADGFGWGDKPDEVVK